MKKIYNKRIYITVIGIIEYMDLELYDEMHCTVWLEHDGSCFVLPLLIDDHSWFFKSMKDHCNEFVKFTGYLSDADQYSCNVGLVVDTIEYLDQPNKEENNG